MTVLIDRDPAHDAAENELAKPIYPKPSITERFWNWIIERLDSLISDSMGVPGGWFTLTILFILVACVIALAIRIALRTMRTNRGAEQGLFGASELSATQHRSTAEQFAATGDWTSAIRHRLRAIARHLEETGALPAVPGRTATELARDASQLAPDLAGEFSTSATIFNDVTYGEQPGTEMGYRIITDLDHRLMSRQPGQQQTGLAADRADWTPVS